MKTLTVEKTDSAYHMLRNDMETGLEESGVNLADSKTRDAAEAQLTHTYRKWLEVFTKNPSKETKISSIYTATPDFINLGISSPKNLTNAPGSEGDAHVKASVKRCVSKSKLSENAMKFHQVSSRIAVSKDEDTVAYDTDAIGLGFTMVVGIGSRKLRVSLGENSADEEYITLSAVPNAGYASKVHHSLYTASKPAEISVSDVLKGYSNQVMFPPAAAPAAQPICYAMQSSYSPILYISTATAYPSA